MAVRRTALESVGGFPQDLGKLRGTLLSGEDHELCRRILAAGLTAVYDPSMRVQHLVPASRLTVGYCLRWFYWSGITHQKIERRADAGRGVPSLFGVPRYLVREAAAAAIKGTWSLIRGRTNAFVHEAATVALESLVPPGARAGSRLPFSASRRQRSVQPR
jgi:GT2 family glycosyltransferase